MSFTSTCPRHRPRTDRPSALRRAASGSAGAIAILYLLIFAGILSVGEATEGEVGVLGFAGVVFAVLAIVLWLTESRLLWAGAAMLQVLVIAAYVSVSTERHPPFEIWGISIRVLQVALLATLVGLFLRSLRARGEGQP